MDKHINRKQGCPYCSKNKKRTLESFINDANKIHNNKYTYEKSIYKGIHKPLIITCPIHGDFKQAPNDHLHGQGCPYCKQSKLENNILTFLNENNIKYICQYKYDKNNLKNRLDFYLPEYNIAIECQGEQHFKLVDFANKGVEWSESLFLKNINNDLNKNKICCKHNIKILYYTNNKLMVFYENVNNILNEKLYSNNNIFSSKELLLKEIRC